MSETHKNQIAGTFFVGLSILFLILYYGTEGSLLRFFVNYFEKFLGTGVILISYFFWITGFKFFTNEPAKEKIYKILEILAWTLFSCCFLMIAGIYGKGGLAGELIYSSFVYVFGKAATIWIAAVFITVSLIITFEVDLKLVWEKVVIFGGILKIYLLKLFGKVREIKIPELKMLSFNNEKNLEEKSDKKSKSKEENTNDEFAAEFELDNIIQKNFENEEKSVQTPEKSAEQEKNNIEDAEVSYDTEEETKEESEIENAEEEEFEDGEDDIEDELNEDEDEQDYDEDEQDYDEDEDYEEEEVEEKPKPIIILPNLELLDNVVVKQTVSQEELKDKANKLLTTLKSFKIDAQILNMTIGPSVTRFELRLAPGIKVSRLLNLSNDIGVALATNNIRIEAPIPGKSAIGIEIPNANPMLVPFREVAYQVKKDEHPLAIGLGKNINGEVVIGNIGKMPHLLIAGSTGSGKSVCVNTIITSILLNADPDEVKFIMVDPKMVELSMYNGIPHLLIPVITDSKMAAGALAWAVNEMEERYSILADEKVKKIEEYNEKMDKLREEKKTGPDSYKRLPFIVVIIDELADLMVVARNEVEESIMRIAQKARAVGIHLIIATQRPSVNVITGVIKANLPSRIAFAVQSNTDSRTILDTGGAENLIGKGDMLYWPIGKNSAQRLQGAFVSNEECERMVEYWANMTGAQYDEEVSEMIAKQTKGGDGSSGDAGDMDFSDDLLPEAVRIIVTGGKASISLLQRKLSVGHARAARLMDMMEAKGIVSQMDQRNKRDILITEDQIDNYV
ncbi:MAG: DNA translocase FtsK [Candidatus Muiribacteriota bacterium]